MRRFYLLVIACTLVALVSSQFTAAQKKSPGKFRMTKEEKKVLTMTNQARKNHNLNPLKPNPILIQEARKYSAKMAKQQKLSHYLGDETYKDRLKAAKYDYYEAGENLAFGYRNAETMFKGWMKSKTHRENILFKKFTEIGVGVVIDKKGVPWYTQLFGKPKKKRK